MRSELWKQTSQLLGWLAGRGNSAREAIKAAVKVNQAPAAGAAIADPAVWIRESFEIAKQKAYASPVKNGNGPYRLTKTYRNAAWKVDNKVQRSPAHVWLASSMRHCDRESRPVALGIMVLVRYRTSNVCTTEKAQL
jgi:hypothetical protein